MSLKRNHKLVQEGECEEQHCTEMWGKKVRKTDSMEGIGDCCFI